MNQDLISFLSIMLGVITSSLYEPAIEFMFPEHTRSANTREVWELVKPYIQKLLSAAIIAIVVFAAAKVANVDMSSWWLAFFVGFGINKGIDIFNAFRRTKA
jgi:hypothetical protein